MTAASLSPAKLRRWRSWLAWLVALGWFVGAVLMAADDDQGFVWSLDAFSLASRDAGLIALAIATVAAFVVGGVQRILACALCLLGLVITCCPFCWLWWWRFDLVMRPLHRLTLADGRTVTAYHVGTPAFARDFCAVRVEQRTWFGLWRIAYLARERDANRVSLELVDATHVRARFVADSARSAPTEQVLAIPVW